jgi:hypothetical protein
MALGVRFISVFEAEGEIYVSWTLFRQWVLCPRQNCPSFPYKHSWHISFSVLNLYNIPTTIVGSV